MSEHEFGKRMVEHIGMGAALGYAILHPVSVVIYNISTPDYGSILTSIISAFYWSHIRMALYFAVIGVIFGMIHGLNIHRLALLYAKVKSLSLTDELTGLYNRRFFTQSLAREHRRAGRYGNDLSLMLIDIDHFKQYNDNNGHPAGDRLLRQFAERMRRGARETDIIVRYGGEEFFILMPDTDIVKAAHLAERLRKDIEAYPFEFRETQPNGKVTVTIGCAHLDVAARTGEQDFINLADQCLYLAKNNGRNRIWC